MSAEEVVKGLLEEAYRRRDAHYNEDTGMYHSWDAWHRENARLLVLLEVNREVMAAKVAEFEASVSDSDGCDDYPAPCNHDPACERVSDA